MADAFPTAVYLLCLATSAACAWLLARSYRRTHARLLLWSALCFTLLAGNNLLTVIDMVVIEHINFRIPRLALSIAAVAVLLVGFIWDMEE